MNSGVDGFESQDPDTDLGAIAHILALLFGPIGPLIVYVFADDDFSKQNAGKALSWQLFFTLYMLLAGISLVVLLGFILIPILLLMNTAFCIIGALKASKGTVWSYPLCVDLFNRQSADDVRLPLDVLQSDEEDDVMSDIEGDNQEDRVTYLKQKYMENEITEEQLDALLEQEIDEEDDAGRSLNKEYN